MEAVVSGESFVEVMLKKCPYSELFWSAFSRIRNGYGEILRISLYISLNNSEYGHSSQIVMLKNQ